MGGYFYPSSASLRIGCDACGLPIAMYSDRCFSVWSDSGELEGWISANPDRDLDLLGEPSVTNIDVLIPGHGPGTLLLVFRTSFSFEKVKNREPCARTILQKRRGNDGQFSNFDF